MSAGKAQVTKDPEFDEGLERIKVQKAVVSKMQTDCKRYLNALRGKRRKREKWEGNRGRGEREGEKKEEGWCAQTLGRFNNSLNLGPHSL